VSVQEVNFDGLVGPSHSYAGLARGNLASLRHGGQVSNPRGAALEGLAKMRRVAQLGALQAVLPPQPRPDVTTLRRLGFTGTDHQVVERTATVAPDLLVKCASASAMWTANAATIVPSADAEDERLHWVPANLATLFHRQIETATTTAVLRKIFSEPAHFVVHDALPPSSLFGDEGAANHTRFAGPNGGLHLFAWGRSSSRTSDTSHPSNYPARQSLEASLAVARLGQLNGKRGLFWQQHPHGIDHGAFHTDVLAVGAQSFLMLHELAFVEHQRLLAELGQRLGDGFRTVVASNDELPVGDAIRAYPFNSQLVTLQDGALCIIAPTEAEETPTAAAFLERVVAADNPVTRVEYLDVRQSMSNGGGPACLRLRVAMTAGERAALGARVLLDDTLHSELISWVERHYRDRLQPADLADPQLLDECHRALDELTQLLALGSVYDFQ
jgi:succinylarginine dihydrolase